MKKLIILIMCFLLAGCAMGTGGKKLTPEEVMKLAAQGEAPVKVSDMTELSTAPASDDLAMIVDVSDPTMAASGTNKKITVANLLSGKGDFSGPASSTSGNFVSFADTTGKLGADSGYSASSFESATSNDIDPDRLLGDSNDDNKIDQSLIGGFNGSATPSLTLSDTDADAVGTGDIYVDAYTAGYDSIWRVHVDDSAGEDTAYIEANGTDEKVYIDKPTDVTGNLSATTYGSDGSVSDAELLYINSLTSNAQTQINSKATISGTPAQFNWAVWADSSTIQGVSVSGSSVVCTDANGQPTACSNLSDTTYLTTASLNSGNFAPTGTWDWTSATVTWPTFNQNTTGTAANLSGTPALPDGTTATTQSAGDNSTKLATTAYADNTTHLQADLGTDLTYSPDTVMTGINAGESIDFGEIVYLNSDGTWHLADNTSATTYPAYGISVSTGTVTSGNPLVVMTAGTIRDDSWTWATRGTMLYLGTSGGMTTTAPSTTDYAIQPVARVMKVAASDSMDVIYFKADPMQGWVVKN